MFQQQWLLCVEPWPLLSGCCQKNPLLNSKARKYSCLNTHVSLTCDKLPRSKTYFMLGCLTCSTIDMYVGHVGMHWLSPVYFIGICQDPFFTDARLPTFWLLISVGGHALGSTCRIHAADRLLLSGWLAETWAPESKDTVRNKWLSSFRWARLRWYLLTSALHYNSYLYAYGHGVSRLRSFQILRVG